jgi:hypothetical protein
MAGRDFDIAMHRRAVSTNPAQGRHVPPAADRFKKQVDATQKPAIPALKPS